MAGDVRQIAASSGTASTRKKSSGIKGFFGAIGRGLKAVGKGIAKVAPIALSLAPIPGAGAISKIASASGKLGRIGKAVQKISPYIAAATGAGRKQPTGYIRGAPIYSPEPEPSRGALVNTGGFGGSVAVRWHATANRMPPAIRDYIGGNSLPPTPEAVQHLAGLLGAGVAGEEGNRLAFPDGEVKVVWHMAEQDDTTLWGWDPVVAGGPVESGLTIAAEAPEGDDLFPPPPFQMTFLNGMTYTVHEVRWIADFPFFRAFGQSFLDLEGTPITNEAGQPI